MRVLGMDGRKAATHVQTLEIGVDDGVQVLVGAEHYYCILVQIELYVALQADGTGEPDAGGNQQAAAALLGQMADGSGKCICIESNAIPHSAKVGERHGKGGDYRLRNIAGDLLVIIIRLPGRTGGISAGRQSHYQSKEYGRNFIHTPQMYNYFFNSVHGNGNNFQCFIKVFKIVSCTCTISIIFCIIASE